VCVLCVVCVCVCDMRVCVCVCELRRGQTFFPLDLQVNMVSLVTNQMINCLRRIQ
jgi:hypothetical protein